MMEALKEIMLGNFSSFYSNNFAYDKLGRTIPHISNNKNETISQLMMEFSELRLEIQEICLIYRRW